MKEFNLSDKIIVIGRRERPCIAKKDVQEFIWRLKKHLMLQCPYKSERGIKMFWMQFIEPIDELLGEKLI